MENMPPNAFPANQMSTSSSLDANLEAFYAMLESGQQPWYEGCNIT